ncbi:hypothetical protein Dfri01_20280 [Dyadobacter frigoris]|nr:hypothetical protein Dfri01_20280 [Dyadobacter frigoris]
MAENKILESEALLEKEFFDAAYYLCGYAVEFSLKSAICNRLSVEMFEGNGILEDARARSFK